MVRVFVRLKLALLSSGLSTSPASTVFYVLGALLAVAGGLLMAMLLVVVLGAQDRFGGLLPIIIFVTVWLMWVLGPLLNTAQGDQTIDPARLELLPLSDTERVRGLLVSGLIGPAALGTLIGGLGAVLAPGLSVVARFGMVVCAVIFLFMCLAWSRALAAVFIGVLNSRRGRDLTLALTGLLALSVYGISERFNNDSTTLITAELSGTGDLILLLPPAALGGALPALRDGEYLLAGGLILWAVIWVGVALLIWRWALNRRIEGGGDSESNSSTSGAANSNVLYPRLVRWLPTSALGAIVAKEARYFMFRSTLQLQQILLGTTIALIVMSQTIFKTEPGPLVNYIGAFVFFMVLWQGAPNVFGIDNAAVASYLLTGVSMTRILLGKMLTLAIIGLPLAVALQVLAIVVHQDWGELWLGLVLIPVPGLVWLGLGAQLSVRTPFPLIPGYQANTATLFTAVAVGLVGSAAAVGAIVGSSLVVTSTTGASWAGALVAWILGLIVAVVGFRDADRRLQRDPTALLTKLEPR